MAENKNEETVRVMTRLPKPVVEQIDSAAGETQRDRSKMVASIVVDWSNSITHPNPVKIKTV